MTVESHVLSQWLSPLESASLECDGFTLVASMLLEREGVPHQRRLGRVTVEGVGDIAYHYWIELRDGRLCDFKARMWLGDDPGVPHGVFENKCARVIYQPAAAFGPVSLGHGAHAVFSILAGRDLKDYPRLKVFGQP
jgi:hypothetical protein